ncbi:phosphoribosylglycinamide formyltransferase [Anaplasma capra]|uniref:phosphoribosylglycinamide formyltransferase n=1 Tax=Anaplasma capra TaxID=1562740 RepID=UPI0021D595A2|nr:phosphoribosylglycinamide formyltransferase [Anaplasma capra]MCU7611828.1 phosphoribosylglycinamide formyltransferase [Anaplasma capra]MCU7612578.1 phosphoribosylglycinamide formyltransferase [Anaplasma capra]
MTAENRLKLGVLISGRGSNMEAIAKACSDGEFPAVVSCVISNNPEAEGLSLARSRGLNTFVVERRPLDTERINRILLDHEVDLVCLAGFMSILREDFVKAWHHKIINIHPSLLPSFKGMRAQEQALKAGVKIAGCTVHYVYPELDAGPIIIQAAVPVMSGDSVESLADRILTAEHACYPEAVRLISLAKVKLGNDGIVEASDSSKLFLFPYAASPA